MKVAFLTGEGILVNTNILECYVKRVRLIVLDCEKGEIINDRMFAIKFKKLYRDLDYRIQHAWNRTFKIHQCWFNSDGTGYSDSVIKIIREIILRHNVKRIFYKGKLMFNFLNEINLEGETGKPEIVHKNMLDLGKKYNIKKWTEDCGFLRDDRIHFYIREYNNYQKNQQSLKKYLAYKM
jgi:hypothetical protein